MKPHLEIRRARFGGHFVTVRVCRGGRVWRNYRGYDLGKLLRHIGKHWPTGWWPA